MSLNNAMNLKSQNVIFFKILFINEALAISIHTFFQTNCYITMTLGYFYHENEDKDPGTKKTTNSEKLTLQITY